MASAWVMKKYLLNLHFASIFTHQLSLDYVANNADLKCNYFKMQILMAIQARIAQLVAYWLGTGEVPGSNLGKGKNFWMKISNWIIQIWMATAWNLSVLFSWCSGLWWMYSLEPHRVLLSYLVDMLAHKNFVLEKKT